MKNIILLAIAIISTQLSFLKQSFGADNEQQITISKNGTGISTSVKFNGTDCTLQELNTECEIILVLDPQLAGVTIKVLDKSGKQVGDNIFTDNTESRRIIQGGKKESGYTIIITYNKGQTTEMLQDVGLNPTIVCTGNVSGPGNGKDCTPPDAGCGCESINSDNIKKAITSCYNCGLPLYVYDARCKKLYKLKGSTYVEADDDKFKFRHNKSFKIGVVHVNRAFKDIKITAKNQVFESQPSPIFQNFFGGTGETALLKSFGAQGSMGIDNAGKKYGTLPDDIAAFSAIITEMIEAQQKVLYECCEATADCDSATKKYSIPDLKDRLKKINDQYENLTTPLKKKVTALANINKEIDSLRKLLRLTTANATVVNAEITAMTATRDTTYADSANTKTQLGELQALWKNFKQPTEEQIRELVLFNRNFLKTNYSYFTGKIKPGGDWLDISINIDSRDTNFIFKNGITPTDHQEKLFNGPVVGKWFISFSSGPFLGGGRNVYEKEYTFKKTPSFGNVINDTSMYMFAEAGYSNPPVGLCGLAHFQKRWNGVSFGGALGVGLTAEEKPKPVYLLGASVFFGNKQQFIVTGGLLGMQVNVLREDLYPTYLAYKSAPELNYYKEFRQGWFVSVSYTLFTIKDGK